MSKRTERGLRYAAKAAALSSAENFKVGAAIMRGSRLISIGWNNTKKTHPASTTRYNAIHAEFAALIGTHKEDLVGATIYVSRPMKSGGFGLAKPCSECSKIIRAAGITDVVYTGDRIAEKEAK